MMETDEDDLNVIICYIKANKDYRGPAFVGLRELRQAHLAWSMVMSNIWLWNLKNASLLKHKRGEK